MIIGTLSILNKLIALQKNLKKKTNTVSKLCWSPDAKYL